MKNILWPWRKNKFTLIVVKSKALNESYMLAHLCGGTWSLCCMIWLPATSSSPEVRIEPRYQTVEVGNPVEFRCIATGSPQPTVEWSKGGTGQLTPGATFDGGVFRIASVTRADEAEYYCKATNTAGTTTVRTILYVTGGKTILPSCQNDGLYLLTCSEHLHPWPRLIQIL